LIVGLPIYLLSRKIHKEFYNHKEDSIQNKSITHYKFTNDKIFYSNEISRTEIKWSGIKSYTIVEHTIFIMQSESIISTIINIGKIQVSEENYNLLIDLLQQKIDFKEYKIKMELNKRLNLPKMPE